MVSVIIRPASIKDVSSIVKVRVGALKYHEISGFSVPSENLYLSKEKLIEIWDKENKLQDTSEVFVAVSDGNVLGFIVLNLNNSDDNIDNLVVAKEEQGKGVGRALVEYVEKLAKSRGFDIITTDTTENSEGVPWKAYGFWKKMGYHDKGKRIPTSYNFKVIPLIKKLK